MIPMVEKIPDQVLDDVLDKESYDDDQQEFEHDDDDDEEE